MGVSGSPVAIDATGEHLNGKAESSEARTHRHEGERDSTRPSSAERNVQGERSARTISRRRSPDQGQDEGEERPRGSRRPLGVLLFLQPSRVRGFAAGDGGALGAPVFPHARLQHGAGRDVLRRRQSRLLTALSTFAVPDFPQPPTAIGPTCSVGGSLSFDQ